MSDYSYDAAVIFVHDGDTVELDVDLGFKTHVRMCVRLWGINAPELATPEGLEAAAYLRQLLPLGSRATLNSFKDRADKYGGRWLGSIINLEGYNVNEVMVVKGHAKLWDGKGPKP